MKGRLLFFSFILLPRLTQAASITNPLGIQSPTDAASTAVKVFLGFVGVIALVIVIYGGFQLMTSQGNPEKIDKGRNALLWATIGLVVVFGSYGITRAIFAALSGEAV